MSVTVYVWRFPSLQKYKARTDDASFFILPTILHTSSIMATTMQTTTPMQTHPSITLLTKAGRTLWTTTQMSSVQTLP